MEKEQTCWRFEKERNETTTTEITKEKEQEIDALWNRVIGK
jgi:predicted 3-demethylubiquinone-9 3-methyltransferase (glyoxalase superfamily)